VEHGNGIRAVQAGNGRAHRLEQVAVVQGVNQVSDHFGVGLAVEHIALGLEFDAQFVVVLDDAVVHQPHTCRPLSGIGTRPVAEVRVGVVHRRGTVSGPTGVGNASPRGQGLGPHLGVQFGDPGRAACPHQCRYRARQLDDGHAA